MTTRPNINRIPSREVYKSLVMELQSKNGINDQVINFGAGKIFYSFIFNKGWI